MEEKNGVKTFIVTLAISMMVFGALFYLVSDFSKEVNIESNSVSSASVSEVKKVSPFEPFTAQKLNTETPTVLGTADEATETTEGTSSVPITGSNDVLVLLLVTLAILCATYLALAGPKKLALSGFEKNATKN